MNPCPVTANTRPTAFLAMAFACAAAALSLSACGGGGGGAAPAPAPPIVVAPPPPAPDPLAPQGTTDATTAGTTFGVSTEDVGGDGGGDSGAGGGAGDGAPLKRAVVVVTDRNGLTRTGTTNDNGNYLVRFPSSFQSPIAVKVVDTGGNVLASASGESPAAGKVLRLNVNPLTDKMVSDALAITVSGTDKPFTGAQIDVAKLDAAKANLVASVQASLAVAGITKTDAFDPVKSVYSYDGNGVDAIIESIAHSRNPNTGATELRAKLAGLTHATNGAVQPSLISASSPLPTTQVAVTSNPALSFSKVNAWIDEINRCLALSPSAFAADANCSDADGSRLIASNYKHHSRDFAEDFSRLLSDPNRTHVQGSTIRNPAILLFTKSAPTVAFDDIAVVEVTIKQPRIGTLAGNFSSPVEYTKALVFRRIDSLTRARAGNWILLGNQRDLVGGMGTRYQRTLQHNPSMQANLPGNAPSRIESRIYLDFGTLRFDAGTRSYVDAGIRAMRVKGPGLPATGVVLTPSSVLGATWLSIFNKDGTIPVARPTNNNSSNAFTVATSLLNGTPINSALWNSAGVNNRDAPLTDFSELQAFARYTGEVFLQSSTSTVSPDSTFTSINLAAVNSPQALVGVAVNDLTPSLGLITANQPPLPSNRATLSASAPLPSASQGGASMGVSWINNPGAAAINQVRVFSTERSPKGANSGFFSDVVDVGQSINGASTLGARQTTQAVFSASGFPGLQDLALGDLRQLSIWSAQARATIVNAAEWRNPSLATSPTLTAVSLTAGGTATVLQIVGFDVRNVAPATFANGQTAAFTSFLFDFGDGTTSFNTTGATNKSYSLPGLYTFRVTARTAGGISAQSFTQVRVVVSGPPNIGSNPLIAGNSLTTLSVSLNVGEDLGWKVFYRNTAGPSDPAPIALTRLSNSSTAEFTPPPTQFFESHTAWLCPSSAIHSAVVGCRFAGVWMVDGIAHPTPIVSLVEFGSQAWPLALQTNTVTISGQSIAYFWYNNSTLPGLIPSIEVATSAAGPWASLTASTFYPADSTFLPANWSLGTRVTATLSRTPALLGGTYHFRICNRAIAPKASNCTAAFSQTLTVQ